MKTQFPNPSRRGHRRFAPTPRFPASEGSQVFRGLVAELEAMSVELQQVSLDLDRCDPEEEDDVVYPLREKLRGLKQTARDRLPGITQQAYPWIVAAEFWKPGLLSAFDEFWPGLPDLLQGPATWLGFMGRLRAFLLEVIGPEPDRATGRVEAASGSVVDLAPPSTEVPGPRAGTNQETERHFIPKELAELWGLDQSTVRRMFRDEPGVLRIPHLRRRGKRDYTSLRIPASVAARVHERRSRSLFKV